MSIEDIAGHAPQPDAEARQSMAQAHPVRTFYLLAFALSWAGYVPVLASQHGVSLFAGWWWRVLLVLPVVGPALAAGLVRHWSLDPDAPGLRTLLQRRAAWPWWVVAAALPPLVIAVANVLAGWSVLATGLGSRQDFEALPVSGMGVALTLGFALVANPWEEVGWRGFALRRLQLSRTPAVAALIVGALWALWHIPLFLWAASPMSRMSFWAWWPGNMANSFLLAWIFNRTSGALAPVILFHVAFNVFGAMLGHRSLLAVSLTDLAVAAIVLLVEGPELGRRRAA